VDNKELKINVISKDGNEVKVLTGKDFHILEDKTKAKLKTGCIKSFAAFCLPLVLDADTAATVFFNDNSAECHENNIDHSSQALAILTLTETTMLKRLREVNHLSMAPAQADDFLASFRAYGIDMNKLLSRVRNTKIKAITEAERTVDNSGNYTLMVTRKGGTREEMSLPESIVFQVPPFELIDDGVELTFEITFNYAETGNTGSPLRIEWTLHCYELEEVIKKAKRIIIEKAFSEFPKNRVIYGVLEISKQDSSWAIKESSGVI
jgi:hypothetical protein